jgi:hypothetical protein
VEVCEQPGTLLFGYCCENWKSQRLMEQREQRVAQMLTALAAAEAWLMKLDDEQCFLQLKGRRMCLPRNPDRQLPASGC